MQIDISPAELRLLIQALGILDRRPTTPYEMHERVQELMGRLEAIEDELPQDDPGDSGNER
jgi:hypothetical protein